MSHFPTVRIEVQNGSVIGVTCDSEVHVEIVDHDVLDNPTHLLDDEQEVRVTFMNPERINPDTFHDALKEINW